MSVNQRVSKVILLGEAGVGKSSVFSRIQENVFTECSKTTHVGIDRCMKVVTCSKGTVQFCLWDTAGLERYRSITKNYYRKTDAVLLMFNVNDPVSLVLLAKWAEDSSYYSKSACKFLVGNKNDLKQKVSKDDVKHFALSHGCDSAFFVSAKTGEGLNDALQLIAERLISEFQESYETFTKSQTWLTDSVYSRKNKNCCF